MIPIRVKDDTVEISNLHQGMWGAVLIAASWFESASASELVITSGHERAAELHAIGSRHWSGDAIDLRTDPSNVWHLWPQGYDSQLVSQLVFDLRAALGSDYDVVNEGDHLHIERHPKGYA